MRIYFHSTSAWKIRTKNNTTNWPTYIRGKALSFFLFAKIYTPFALELIIKDVLNSFIGASIDRLWGTKSAELYWSFWFVKKVGRWFNSFEFTFSLFKLNSLYACTSCILRAPGAASWEDAIFSGDVIFLGESLHQEQKSPWAITLTGPLLEALKFLHADWPQK